ncbi:hypothetical protein LRK24_02995 [Rhodanobacter denitrificans]|uniref:hypothetical protein n=1 Tax=Rhodanobacter denitrificans TaxID=666685 RepID=UPI0012FD0973|nr:hypothetical protein [Rhodanobacter denitrificans]UJM90887.1 hypothetical protein LRK24_02995 [Rhodanobacter denitrificans]
MDDKRQAEGRFLLGPSLLLWASCPSPFGPASLFAHASCVHVDKQKRNTSASAGGRKPLPLTTPWHQERAQSVPDKRRTLGWTVHRRHPIDLGVVLLDHNLLP